MTAATRTRTKTESPTLVTPELPTPEGSVGLVFEAVDVPVVSAVSVKTNPYVAAVKGLAEAMKAGKEGALSFSLPVSDRGVSKDFAKIKRELQDAGSVNDATVRSFIYNADKPEHKLVMPAEKGAKIKLVLISSGADVDVKPETVTRLLVKFWVAPTKIVRTASPEAQKPPETPAPETPAPEGPPETPVPKVSEK